MPPRLEGKGSCTQGYDTGDLVVPRLEGKGSCTQGYDTGGLAVSFTPKDWAGG